MESTRYLDCLAADYAALRAAAITAGPDARVPSCPDWTVAGLLEHVAEVYLHKVAVLRGHEWPKPWPPDFSGEDPAALLDRGYRELTAEFAARQASEPALTFYEPQQTVLFWLRRMAQETVIHRIDAELAAGAAITPVPDDLGTDGVDEVLKVFLAPEAAGWPDEFAALPGGHLAGDDGKDAIVVTACPGSGNPVSGNPVSGNPASGNPVSWTLRPAPRSVTVTDGADQDGVRVTLSGPPGTVLRWMWGRADDDAVTIAGDRAWAGYLRRMLVPATQLSPRGIPKGYPQGVSPRGIPKGYPQGDAPVPWLGARRIQQALRIVASCVYEAKDQRDGLYWPSGLGVQDEWNRQRGEPASNDYEASDWGDRRGGCCGPGGLGMRDRQCATRRGRSRASRNRRVHVGIIGGDAAAARGRGRRVHPGFVRRAAGCGAAAGGPRDGRLAGTSACRLPDRGRRGRRVLVAGAGQAANSARLGGGAHAFPVRRGGPHFSRQPA
jgi:uncharacterized protein (TIGR03083 family)